MGRMLLSEEERLRVARAVEEAEKNTSGEIATALIRESSDYGVYELLFSLGAGFLFFSLLLLFHSSVAAWVGSFFWDGAPWQVTAFYGLATAAVVGGVYFAANLPFVDRLIIPRGAARRAVRHRALRHFTESGVYATRDRTGILIFISLLERRVELLADKGIAEKIPQEEWELVLRDLTAAVKEGRLAEGLCRAAGSCGEKLAEHFPIKADDTNELSDHLVLLES